MRTSEKIMLKTSSSQSEEKASRARPLIALASGGRPVWTPRDYASLAREGYQKNVVAHRCVRLLAESAASVPLMAMEAGRRMSVHPLLDLIERPNPEQTRAEFFEAVYGHLQTSGNAYIEAVSIDGEVRELYALRPDRMKARLSDSGWPAAYDYTVGGRTVSFPVARGGETPSILHMRLFNPTDDHYGLSPLEAAAIAIDVHNATQSWNKALLDNAARPSGALVYSGPEGAAALSEDQFQRLKDQLEEMFQGGANAGRPLLLDGGLDWRQMALSPTDMDFISAKNSAARDIALAFGVPPMLLGIPGDNTYSNYREANLAFWRHAVAPLAKKAAAALSKWLGAAFDGAALACDLDEIDALSAERDARWRRIASAEFLTDAEKRRLLAIDGEV